MRIRFWLALVLSLALHVAAPLAPEAMEGAVEWQEANRLTHARSPLRSVRDVPAPRIADPTDVVSLRLPPSPGPAARTRTAGWVRKTPLSASSGSSSPED